MSDRWATFDCYGTLINWDHGIQETLSRCGPIMPATRCGLGSVLESLA